MARNHDDLTGAGSARRPEWAGLSAPTVHRRIARLARVLARTYGTPDLGNLPDPLDEAIFIVLTYQTDVPRARAVWQRLKMRFPKWEELLAAPSRAVERALLPSGLHRSRARIIRGILRVVRAKYGALSLADLQQMSDREAEARLRALPGIDIKGARCVLLYALHRPVFPVDSNAFRFMQRFGILDEGARYRRLATHNALQRLVPSPHRHSLHVNLVVHGQRVCRPRNPQCAICAVRRPCETGRLVRR